MNIMEFAINMEVEGEYFYREQAEKNIGNNLFAVFSALAEDEKVHADVLRKKMNKVPYLTGDSNLKDINNIFRDEEHFASNIKERPDQLDFYRMALEKETESINLYRKLKQESIDDTESELFGFLIEQEEKHFRIIEDFIMLLERPEAWVESAEFGTREDY